MSYISIDSSTSSTTVVVFDDNLKILKRFQKEHKQIYTPEGFIEHDLGEIYENLIELMRQASQIAPDPHLISMTNQRETLTLFDKSTGKPVRNAIVWQCTRGQEICKKIQKNQSHSELITKKTGLKVNSFFSASKLKWIIENEIDLKNQLEKGDILFGTIDTYLLYRLTGCSAYVTDTTNASRTLLFNCIKNKWDPELFSIFEIKEIALADIKPSASNFGVSNFENSFSKDIPITGVAGDAQASFFANLCLNIGDTKITTGTGFNIQTNIGTEFFTSSNSFTTLAFTHNNKNFYSLECLSSVAGATISWLKNNLQLIQSADESETLSNLVPDTGGVSLIPAFTGLGPPYWKENARAAFLGINASTNKNHLVRAALESIAFQIVVYLESLRESDELRLNSIIVDGGLIKNRLFLEMIADLLKIEIRIPIIEDMSLYGALLFGIQKQKNLSDLKTLHSFAVKQNTISYKDNSKLSLSYQNWKNLINKHF
ncbi:FGGY family carbohydrate kinase [Alphaproteobacteria bacterium]|nr:FGGY family carbohydrate kinase [Alphaproteobacteria bacterium]